MADETGPAPAQLELWLEQVDRALADVQIRLEPVLAEQARLQERRLLLKELLASYGDDRAAADGKVGRASALETTRERVHRQAVEIMSQTGRALHSNDLLAEFVRRGYDVPGSGRANNITVHLSGWHDVVSPERGMYGLVEHVGEQPSKPMTRRTRKVK